ncbi:MULTISPECIES: cyclic lactone autoinducer peptide [Clostridium]|nr:MULTISPECIES: cyclic lactone autoinducer peptide [Clostridium]
MKKNSLVLKGIGTASLAVAKMSAGTACWGLWYQPAVPKKLKK